MDKILLFDGVSTPPPHPSRLIISGLSLRKQYLRHNHNHHRHSSGENCSKIVLHMMDEMLRKSKQHIDGSIYIFTRDNEREQEEN